MSAGDVSLDRDGSVKSVVSSADSEMSRKSSAGSRKVSEGSRKRSSCAEDYDLVGGGRAVPKQQMRTKTF